MPALVYLTINTPNLPTNIVDVRGFDSSIILIQRGGTLMSIGDFPESSSQVMLAGIILVGRLGVHLNLEVRVCCGWEIGLPSPDS